MQGKIEDFSLSGKNGSQAEGVFGDPYFKVIDQVEVKGPPFPAKYRDEVSEREIGALGRTFHRWNGGIFICLNPVGIIANAKRCTLLWQYLYEKVGLVGQ